MNLMLSINGKLGRGKIKCVMYMNQFLKIIVLITYCKHVLIKKEPMD